MKGLVAEPNLDKQILQDRKVKLLRREQRRCAAEHAEDLEVSERQACRWVYQPRGTQRYPSTQHNDDDALTRAIIALAAASMALRQVVRGIPNHLKSM